MRARTAILLLMLILVVLFLAASTSAGDVPGRQKRQALLQEKATLLALKQGLRLPSAAALADWNESNAHVCGFTGVTCDWRQGHVVGLSLANVGIAGAIPPVIGELSHLRILDLSNNKISGQVPASVANLTRLESLFLNNNDISDTIPSIFSSLLPLRMLRNVDVSYNLISGDIPLALGSLIGEQLQSLNVSDNNISGAIPLSIGNLTRLEYLYMQNNNVSGGIPLAICNLTSLLELEMSGNQLTGQIPAELSNIRDLGAIHLRGNQLHGGIPPSLSELTAMFYLGLEQNDLSGTIPPAILLNCTQLALLDVGDNNLSGEIPRAISSARCLFVVINLYSNNLNGTLPRWLANCTQLMTLDVENNLLDDELPTSIISGNQELTYLHLSNNRFLSHDNNSNLEPFFVALSNCTLLQEVEAGAVGMRGQLPWRLGSLLPMNTGHLNLELNAIEGPIPASIGDIINMMWLNLSSNLLNGTIPTSLCRLKRLERLVLSNNALTGEIPACIGDATGLGEIDLSGNVLSGAIPSSIRSLSELQTLTLQRNELSGAIPSSLGRCTALLVIDLSCNSLTGVIPEEITGIAMKTLNLSRNQLGGKLPAGLGSMQQVEKIDLSWNNFNGEILPRLGECIALTVLDLSHNSLAGDLPPELGGLKNLESLNVSNNHLSGEIPTSLTDCYMLKYLNLSYNDFSGVVPTTGPFVNFSCLSYLGNRRLSGPVLRRCRERHRSWYQSRKFLVVLCVCSAVLAFALTILCAVSVRKIRERVASMREDMFRGRRGGGSSPVMKYKFPRITYRELVEATDEFSEDRLVGTGSYGRVYRGALRDGTMVAVKVLQLQTGNSTKSFNRECQVLKRIRHRNLMRIVTACSLPDFKALVLPFMANGSLERCLYAGPPAELSLVQRVNICSDIAEGMAYLHHHSPVKVIHCDLKPSNVLINDDMTALVSDFGISRLVMSIGGVANAADVGASTANMLCGSIGYIPPEYGYGSNTTTKGDVYSFGVLVLEMVTRRKPTDDMFEAGLSLHKWVKAHYHGRADAVVDQALVRMVRDQTPEVRRMSDVAIGELLELGILCSQDQASARPTMMDAADDLDRLKRYLGGDTTATFASSLGFSSTTLEVEDID
ncbi:putative leucine-rich repeat receptor-like serine/threonine-protein kinase At2g24130 [Zea mays]|uniref:non-specific serine/threonine protein kinase n=1 Tax=Zea mays TaxID=4577 RepID=A0A1D6I4K2_MAIZE|nr:putative leucine-rich repeat receptor-like serine/threonine-protein kinase At2g24130 [Zea mays]ONM55069.1 Putative leucine-rich repeat receptor-like serine/threonine-protein kinase [Zea mays]|eukprot:XP_008652733.1 putative leucine-rich repeat receptor-like serine/threonine-protein kinase At2g24130 [Zea mays]